MPTEVIFYNGFAVADTTMPSEIDITFAKTGEVKRYYVVLDGIDQLSQNFDVTVTNEYKVTARVYPNSTMDFELFSFELTFTVKKVSVTRHNSTIASQNMSSDLLYDSFEVYEDADNGNSVYNTNNYLATTTFYPDGKFISLEEWNKVASNSYRMSRYMTTGEYLYKVLGNGTVVDGRVAVDGNGDRIGTPTYYQYDSTTKTYTVVDVQGTARNTYVFVYTVSQQLEVDWNVNQTALSVKGGDNYVYATVSNGGASTEVKVPIFVLDGTAVAISADATDFVDSDAVSSYMEVTDNTLTFTFDPFVTPNVFEQLSTGNYKYFPARATITVEGGNTVNVPVTWDFGIAKVNCQGGTYNITAILDGSEFGVGTQSVRARLVIIDRTAVGIVESANSGLTSNVGYMWQDSTGKTQTYINPYEYYSSTLSLPNSLTVEVKTATGTEQITFSTTNNTYKLAWSMRDFRPTYTGGITYLTAVLTGPDGSSQNLNIPFLVQKMTVSKITTVYYVDEERVASPKIKATRYSTGAYTSAVVNGVASVGYNLSLGSFPKGLKVTFTVENPVVDSEGNVTFVTATNGGTGWEKHANGDKFSKVFAYVSTIMPTTVTSNAVINVQIGSGERVKITIAG